MVFWCCVRRRPRRQKAPPKPRSKRPPGSRRLGGRFRSPAGGFGGVSTVSGDVQSLASENETQWYDAQEDFEGVHPDGVHVRRVTGDGGGSGPLPSRRSFHSVRSAHADWDEQAEDEEEEEEEDDDDEEEGSSGAEPACAPCLPLLEGLLLNEHEHHHHHHHHHGGGGAEGAAEHQGVTSTSSRHFKPPAGLSIKPWDPPQAAGHRWTTEQGSYWWEAMAGPEFPVRGRSYLTDKRKVPSAAAIYRCVGADMFTFEKKEPHVARLVSLPPLPAYAHMTSADLAALPPLLVTTISIPTYPASIFAAGDGPNVTLVFYHVLPAEFNPATYENQVALELVRRMVAGGRDPDSGAPTRDDLKMILRVGNIADLKHLMNSAECSLLTNYNGKPVLTRPQHFFFRGPSYWEVDVDYHRFGYLGRKGLDMFRERAYLASGELAFVVQGNRAEALPEVALCAVRCHGLSLTERNDFCDYAAAAAAKAEEARSAAAAAAEAAGEGRGGGGGGESAAAASSSGGCGGVDGSKLQANGHAAAPVDASVAAAATAATAAAAPVARSAASVTSLLAAAGAGGGAGKLPQATALRGS